MCIKSNDKVWENDVYRSSNVQYNDIIKIWNVKRNKQKKKNIHNINRGISCVRIDSPFTRV